MNLNDEIAVGEEKWYFQKRKKARQRLRMIYKFSQWYSAKYEAGKALGMKKAVLKRFLDEWVGALSRDIVLNWGCHTLSMKGLAEKSSKAKKDLQKFYEVSESKESLIRIGMALGMAEESVLSDILLSGKNFALSREELAKVYNRGGIKAGAKAGRALGFSFFRILAHEFTKADILFPAAYFSIVWGVLLALAGYILYRFL
ncbi:MAG: hypothetical protein HYT36_00050 [Candidatus Staskawiczbacteria bacterium]|nr:hypothetical protein [Candidatus Staskawiczbacteria bacterium]